MKRVVVLDVVGLTMGLIGEHTPGIRDFMMRGQGTDLRPAFPAVTCTAQANMMTGLHPSRHGIVGNGWYNYDLAEVQFWKQPEQLVQSMKIWDVLRNEDRGFTCAKTFWWYNMYSSADFTVTPRPSYPADGRKVFDIYTWPYAIRPELKERLGEFPFPTFWGPAAGKSGPQGSSDAVSRWISRAAQWMEETYRPGLQMVYLPHLDYNLQRYGPDSPAILEDLKQIDAIVSELIKFFESRDVEVVIVSEYGIVPVNNPIHLNRLFREKGWLTIKEELGLELIDFGASQVFAVADHQVAHIYISESSMVSAVCDLLNQTKGVERVYCGPDELAAAGINHERGGRVVVEAQSDSWFTYYYWMEDERAPDFARCVDIHRKPGYDPCELFIDPEIRFPKLKIVSKLLQKRIGFRMLMDVIPLDANLVKGSHGKFDSQPNDRPVCLYSGNDNLLKADPESTDIFSLIYTKVTGKRWGGPG